MGVIEFANLDLDALSAADEAKALEIDLAREKADEAIAAGEAAAAGE